MVCEEHGTGAGEPEGGRIKLPLRPPALPTRAPVVAVPDEEIEGKS
jgi:hypothetical protein